jgi:hypothetical protein
MGLRNGRDRKAEKLLGKTTIDEISTKDSKLVASLKLK